MNVPFLKILCVCVFVGACASKHSPLPGALKAEEGGHSPGKEASHHAPAQHAALTSAPPAHTEEKSHEVAAAAATSHQPQAKESPSSAPDANHSPSFAGVKQLQWLKNGNARFTKNHQRNDFKSRAVKASFLEKISDSDKPHSIVLSCSDSRVPPELVFDQVMGEIFVIRVAGGAVDSSVIASIEHAAERLGTELIVVMGHESCDAVKAAMSTPEGNSAGSPDLDKLISDIRQRLAQSARTPAGASSNLQEETWANAKGVAKDLLSRSKVISELNRQGKIRIVSALYKMKSGVVEFE